MAQQSTVVNKFGTMTGWNNLTANFLGRDVQAFNSIKYDDEVALENVYGAGQMPIGRTKGNYTPSDCEIGLYKEEMDGLSLGLPPGKRIQDIDPFDITVAYELPSGRIQIDRIRNAQFKNRGIDVKQGDGSIVTVYKLIISHIEWDVAA